LCTPGRGRRRSDCADGALDSVVARPQGPRRVDGGEAAPVGSRAVEHDEPVREPRRFAGVVGDVQRARLAGVEQPGEQILQLVLARIV